MHAHQKWSLPLADTYFAPMLAKDPRGFEIDHLEAALTHCKHFRTAVDGGAHIGTWSARMATRFDKVMAFEPAVDTCQCLSENLHGASNVDIYQMALGAVLMSGEIIDDPSRAGNTGARHLKVGGIGSVTIVPLDEFEIADLDFLKLDVEGYELQALTGAAETLKRCRPVVMIECKKFTPPRFGSSPQAATAYLVGLGYREVGGIRNDRVFA